MTTVFTWILGFLKIVIVLGTLITIHELGHFTVAKLCKVRVNKFAIGFGPRIFKKQGKETEYTLRLFPFGGFVQMEGEEERSDDPNAFNNKNVWQRIAIVAAGPIVNVVFALVVYFCICSANNIYYTTIVSDLTSDNILYEAGIRNGDVIEKVNGKKVTTLRHIDEQITKSESDEIIFELTRNNELLTIPVNIAYETRGYFGVGFSNSGDVAYIYKNSPADEAGLMFGDIVTSVNGEIPNNVEELVGSIRVCINSDITLEVLRNGETVKITGKTQSKTQRYYVINCEVINPGFFAGIPFAIDETNYYLYATLKGTAEIFTGKTENVEVLGPVGIATEISSTEALSDFFYLMSAISLSLGIFNLIPIPALDGGRIFILLIEAIRRKPLQEKVEQGLILAGFAAIMLLAICVTVSDVIKIF